MTSNSAATLRNARIRAEARRAYRELLDGDAAAGESDLDPHGGEAGMLDAVGLIPCMRRCGDAESAD